MKANTPVLIITLAFLYFVSGKLSFFFLSDNYFITIGLFAAEGISLAFALYFGKRVIPGIFLGQFALAFSNGLDIGASSAIGLVNSTEAFMALWILTKLKFDIKLSTFRDFGLLFGVIIIILQPYSGFVSNAYLLYNGDIPSGTYLSSSMNWIIGNTVGQFLYTPFLLLFFAHLHKINWFRFLSFGIATGLFFYILTIVIRIENPFLLFGLTFPLVVLLISRYGLFYGTFFNVIVSGVAAYSVHKKIGAFFVHSQMNNVINYDIFILAHIAIVITAGILFDERKRNEQTLQKAVLEAVEKNEKQQLLMLQQSRLAQMGEMISMIAHQWRQPLNSLALTVQIFEKKYRTHQADSEYVEKFKTNAMKLINHMSATIDDFRTFFAPQNKKSEFHFNAVIDHTTELILPVFETYNISIVYENKTDIVLFGYQNKLGQAIINILNNAKDALIDQEIEDKQIILSVHTDGKQLSLSISDNAGGIPEDIMDKIFDPYFSTKEKKNGTGLGLYMTKIIIEEHCSGRLLVANNGKGAVFTILLPLT